MDTTPKWLQQAWYHSVPGALGRSSLAKNAQAARQAAGAAAPACDANYRVERSKPLEVSIVYLLSDTTLTFN
jgi:hypothetical protein